MKIEDDGCLNNRLNSKACRWNWKKKKAVLVNWIDWKRRRCPYSAFWTCDRVIATAWNYIMTQITDFEQFTRWHDQAKRKINDRNAFKETAITRDPWNKRSTSFVLVMSISVWSMKTNPFLEKKRKNTGGVTFDLQKDRNVLWKLKRKRTFWTFHIQRWPKT